MPYEKIPVECYSGYRANERPMALPFRSDAGKWLKSLIGGMKEVLNRDARR